MPPPPSLPGPIPGVNPAYSSNVTQHSIGETFNSVHDSRYVQTYGQSSSPTLRSNRKNAKQDSKDKKQQKSGSKGRSLFSGANRDHDEAGRDGKEPNKGNTDGSLRFSKDHTGFVNCPWYDGDNILYQRCSGFSTKRFSDVTQHIERNHVLKEQKSPYCPHCRTEFPDPKSRDNHLQLRSCGTASASDTGVMLPKELHNFKKALKALPQNASRETKMQLVRESIGLTTLTLPQLELCRIITIPNARDMIPMALDSSLRRHGHIFHNHQDVVLQISNDITEELSRVSHHTRPPVAAEASVGLPASGDGLAPSQFSAFDAFAHPAGVTGEDPVAYWQPSTGYNSAQGLVQNRNFINNAAAHRQDGWAMSPGSATNWQRITGTSPSTLGMYNPMNLEQPLPCNPPTYPDSWTLEQPGYAPFDGSNGPK
ncbi:hypothetical protein B0T10DRAFT_467961 [Thelonectria olida]|uniref:Uncharacterized protein n=1 Tax=Thelonectria olida TaxID=1576542 RepID=A0A9P8VP68_9HYPO|nr:hypothetical protein B0T10DRAFT_467961 [Thelonectria olida]